MYEIFYLLGVSAVIGLLSAFILNCLGKWGIIEYYQTHFRAFCHFCWGFWFSVILFGLFIVFVNHEKQIPIYIIIPIIASVISRKMFI